MALQLVGEAGRVLQFHRGDRLRKAREEAGIQVQDMAERLGVDRGTVTRYEHNRGVRKLVVEAYARITGADERWLQTGEPPDKWGVTIRYTPKTPRRLVA